MKPHIKHDSDFPSGLAAPARRALAEAGYTQLAELTKMTEAELGQLHGVGPKTVLILQSAMHRHGLSFAAAAPASKPDHPLK